MLPQIVLLPPLGHKEAIGTLGYPIASKLGDQLAFGHFGSDTQTHTGLYNIDITVDFSMFEFEASGNKAFKSASDNG